MHRLYRSRHCGGRRLLSMEVIFWEHERQFPIYFKAQHSALHKAIFAQDQNYTPLQLYTEEYEPWYLKERAEHGGQIDSMVDLLKRCFVKALIQYVLQNGLGCFVKQIALSSHSGPSYPQKKVPKAWHGYELL
jgi:hypothetical protein